MTKNIQNIIYVIQNELIVCISFHTRGVPATNSHHMLISLGLDDGFDEGGLRFFRLCKEMSWKKGEKDLPQTFSQKIL